MKDSKRLDLMGRGLAWENVTKAKTNSAGHALLEIAPRIAAMEDKNERLRAALTALDERLKECANIPASAADAYDTFYREMVMEALGPNVEHDRRPQGVRVDGPVGPLEEET